MAVVRRNRHSRLANRSTSSRSTVLCGSKSAATGACSPPGSSFLQSTTVSVVKPWRTALLLGVAFPPGG